MTPLLSFILQESKPLRGVILCMACGLSRFVAGSLSYSSNLTNQQCPSPFAFLKDRVTITDMSFTYNPNAWIFKAIVFGNGEKGSFASPGKRKKKARPLGL
jgi:hypothetical protein